MTLTGPAASLHDGPVLLLHGRRLPTSFMGEPAVTVVPLNAYADLSELPSGWSVFDARTELVQHYLPELRSRVESGLHGLARAFDSEDYLLVEYQATVLCTVLEYWKLVYSLVDGQLPKRKVLSDSQLRSEAVRPSLASTLAALRLHCMHDQFADTVGIASRASDPDVDGLNRRRVASALPERADAMVGFAVRVSDSLRFRTSVHLGALRRAGPTGSTALIIAQKPKRSALLSQLKGRVPYRLTTVAALALQHSDSDMEAVPYDGGHLDSGSAMDALATQIRSSIAEIRANHNAIATLSSQDWTYLLTDQEYDPVVRELVTLTLAQPGRRVVATPEGAQSVLNDEMLPTVLNAFKADPAIVRCATSAGEAERLTEVFGCESIPSGYLAKAPRFSSARFALTRLAARALLRSPFSPTQRPVLVNVDNEEDLGMTRVGWPSMTEKLQSHRRLIAALQGHAVPYIVTCKSSVGLEAIRELDRGYAYGVFAHIPWTILASLCSVVIQRDSSLGPEAVSLGIPTIIWNDVDLPLASRQWATDNNPYVQLCSNESDLMAALSIIDRGLPKRKVPHSWDLIVPERQIADWILADIQAPEDAIRPKQREVQ